MLISLMKTVLNHSTSIVWSNLLLARPLIDCRDEICHQTSWPLTLLGEERRSLGLKLTNSCCKWLEDWLELGRTSWLWPSFAYGRLNNSESFTIFPSGSNMNTPTLSKLVDTCAVLENLRMCDKIIINFF